jgi:predicted DNA-binding transcriptional regulator YafY
MKIDRLLGIITILLQDEITTAPKLAEKFEVSRRTINRDIEDLCKAGIPLVTLQGSGGGIRIAEGYKLDKTLLTTKEMQAILAGLKSLDSVSGTNQYNQLLDKIYYGANHEINDNVYDASGNIMIVWHQSLNC